MFNKVLIANRGEIAVRIIRACRELGISTLAIVSEADRDSLHAYIADDVVCVGTAPSSDSYLNIQNILSAAAVKGADAIHPGFGFLSENAEFAEMCAECNITFIGPTPDNIRLLGDKAIAKQTMKKANVPTIPGSDGEVTEFEEVLTIAESIGFPLLIKAAAGGGGRGIRIVQNKDELLPAFEAAKAEAVACFGYGGVYIEKYLSNTRHVEFQIFADNFGNVVHLGERDCSLQRRNQKILEETPCPVLSDKLRQEMGNAAVRAAKAIGYRNTGTVEFLLDENLNYYFMEMNTRIQVEHPITEMVTGIDLVKEQITVAAGKPLSFSQGDIALRGHSIECRINAENPSKNFMPSSGTINVLHIPGGNGIRFDSHLYQGYKVPTNYDSMLGKAIVWARTRNEAISKMNSFLSEAVIEGIDTNISFHTEILNSKMFKNGKYYTKSIEEMLKEKAKRK